MESVSESRPLSASESERPEPMALEPAVDPAAGAVRERRRKTLVDAVCLLVLTACGAGFLWARHGHELTYPVPWPDEGSFLWPALAFRDRFSLFAPELYPPREVFWMPPGFMVLEGLIFKIWSFSLGRARLLSAIFLMLALGCVGSMLKNSRVRIAHALILGLFLFSPIFQLAGNTARMEGLVLLVGSSGFALMHRKRWAGLAILGFAPLVHPIGLPFVLVGAAYWFAFVRRGRILDRADQVALAVAALCWAGYAEHVITHFQFFYDDMAAQVKFKSFVFESNGGVASRLREPLMLAPSAAVALAVACAVRFGAPIAALIALAVSSLLAFLLTEGWLYDIYPAFGAMLASLLVLEGATAFFAHARARATDVRLSLDVAIVAAVILLVDAKWVVLNPFLMRSVRSSTATTWNHNPSYLSAREHAQVADFLRGLGAEGRETAVQFLPDSDALLFENVRTPSVQFVQQTFYESKPDVFILHRSPWFPPFIYEVELMGVVLRMGITVPLEAWHEIARGDESSWIVVKRQRGKIDWR